MRDADPPPPPLFDTFVGKSAPARKEITLSTQEEVGGNLHMVAIPFHSAALSEYINRVPAALHQLTVDPHFFGPGR